MISKMMGKVAFDHWMVQDLIYQFFYLRQLSKSTSGAGENQPVLLQYKSCRIEILLLYPISWSINGIDVTHIYSTHA